MLNRFKEKLINIISKKNIHLNSGVLSEGLLAIAGISSDSIKNGSDIINFSYQSSAEKSIAFGVSDVSLADLNKLFDLFEINPETYTLGHELTVRESCIEEKVFPKFKKWFDGLSVSELTKFELKSLASLEHSAIHDITRLASELVKQLDKRCAKHGSLRVKETALLRIANELNDVNSFTINYRNAHKHLCSVVMPALASLINGTGLTKGKLKYHKADALLQKLKDYELFNRQESALANKKIPKQLATFLAKYKVAISETDAFEETLLKMAQVDAAPTKCKTDVSYFDRARFQVTYHNISKKDAEKIVTHFKQYDRTTMLDDNNRYGSHAASMSMESAYVGQPKKNDEVYSITFDGEAMQNRIMPLFKKAFIKEIKTHPKLLKAYQEKSKECFKNEVDPSVKVKAKTKSNDKTKSKTVKKAKEYKSVAKDLEKIISCFDQLNTEEVEAIANFADVIEEELKCFDALDNNLNKKTLRDSDVIVQSDEEDKVVDVNSSVLSDTHNSEISVVPVQVSHDASTATAIPTSSVVESSAVNVEVPASLDEATTSITTDTLPSFANNTATLFQPFVTKESDAVKDAAKENEQTQEAIRFITSFNENDAKEPLTVSSASSPK